MIRKAQDGDHAAIEAHLARHPETSMYLRQALLAHGPLGGTDRFAARFWVAEGPEGLRGCVALTNNGLAMVQWPGISSAEDPAIAEALAEEKIHGMNGEAGQIAHLRRALGLATAPATLDRTEPLYHLPLADLRIPDGPTTLRAPQGDERPLLDRWRADYMIEGLGAVPGTLTEIEARKQIDGLIGQDRLRVLADGARPVALCAFNARIPGMVQVGGVWTPPANRGQGHARRAVALHLAEARAAGDTTAILFAANAAAARAYEAIGFQRIGGYHLLMLASPVRVAA